jgi:hypothetical protein
LFLAFVHALGSKARPGRAWETSRYVTWARAALVLSLSMAGNVACEVKDAQILRRQTVEVACATCIFKMEGVRGCHWAVELEGRHYLIEGAVPEHHESHSPEGMCRMPRRAVVDGKLKGGVFLSERFDLLPATNVPGVPPKPHQH